MDPMAQYMDPADVLPFAEYRWCRESNRDGRKAWDAMRDDVDRNGFREAAILEYNHVTGQGYLGEGNHRLGIAIELGRAVPVVVHWSAKTAPDYPMRQVTEPGRYSRRDAWGFSRFPEAARPAEIGLPTVPHERLLSIEQRPGTREPRIEI